MSVRARVLAALVLASAAAARANDFYVSPTASASGTGALTNPWQLQTALSQPAAVHAGDTIWLRGGTYSGAFNSNLTGSALGAVVVRSYPGELARIDGAGVTGSIVTIQGAYAVYRDFEVMSSSNPNPDGGQGSRPQGFQVIGPNNKLVNLIVHDTGQGFGFWEAASDSEISGCLIYYNGNSQLDHGIYTQNVNGTKWITNNVIFRNYGFGVHGYTSGAHLNNYDIEGNASFNNGGLNQSLNFKSNFLLGAGNAAATSCSSSPQVAQNPKFIGNFSYNARGASGREIDLGYSTGSCNPTATGNYLVGDTTLNLGPAFGVIAITGNTFYGPVSGFSAAAYPVNTYLASRPATTKVFLVPNANEAGRAHVVVYNWGNLTTVAVDVSAVLSVGATFEVRNAQNFLGAPVLTGVYAGGTLTLPLTGLVPAAPIGQATPPASSEFNVFVLRAVASGPTPTPTLTPTPTPTPTSPPPTATRTPTSVPPTATRTPTPTAAVPTATPTRTPTAPPPTPTFTRTPTPVPPTATRTRTPTAVPATPTRTPTAGPPVATGFYTLTPCRLVDTRNAAGPLGGPALGAGATRTFVLAGHCGIPAGAVSLTAVVAVTAPSADGYLTLYAANRPRPLATSLNYRAGRSRSNNTGVALGVNGDVSVYAGQASGSTHLILDVTGYYR